MISLKSILLKLDEQHHKDPFDDLLVQNYNVQEWRGNWARFRQRLQKALVNWQRTGFISDEEYEDVSKTLKKLDEFFASVAGQSTRLMLRGMEPVNTPNKS